MPPGESRNDIGSLRKFAAAPARVLRRRPRATGVAIAAALAGMGILLTEVSAPAPAAPVAFGEALFAAGDYHRAAETLRAAYRAAPSAELQMQLARALYASGDFAGVLETLGANESDELAPARHILRAEALGRLGRYEEARAAAERAGGPYAGRLSLIAARTLYLQGAHDSAKSALAEALRQGGESLAEAWLFRVRVALEEGDAAGAEAALARAADAGATARSLSALKIEMLIRGGETAAAREEIARSLEGKRERGLDRRSLRVLDAESEYLLALADAAEGDYGAAARRVRRIEPWLVREFRGRLVLAALKAGAGDAAQAESLLIDAVRAAPSDPVALDALAAFRIARGGEAEATDAVRALEEVAPGLGAVRRFALLKSRGDIDGMIAVARTAPDAPLPPFASSVLFGPQSEAGRRDLQGRPRIEALFAGAAAIGSPEPRRVLTAAKALFAMTDDAVAQTLAGDLLLQAGDERARSAYAQASRLAPTTFAPLEGLTRMDVRQGSYWAAERRLRERLEARLGLEEPEVLGLRVALARVLRVAGRPEEGVGLLASAEQSMLASVATSRLYAELLAAAGDGGRLSAFAGKARRAFPSAPEMVDILILAGHDGEAAEAARRAVLAAPQSPVAQDAYRSVMERLGRGAEADSLLAALRRNETAADALSPAPSTLGDLHKVYAAAPGNAAAALQFGTALAAAGRAAEAAMVRREACYWGARQACPDRGAEET